MVWSNSDIPAFYPDLTRVLRTETRKELRLREKLANDEIAALMRRLEANDVKLRIIEPDDCEPLPFDDPREVGE